MGKKKTTYRKSGKCGPQLSLTNYAEGVFSIAATIDVARLVTLDLRYENGMELGLDQMKIKNNMNILISAFFSFLFVCRARGRHVKVYDCLDTVDDVITFLNGVYLLLSAFLPVCVATVAAWSTNDIYNEIESMPGYFSKNGYSSNSVNSLAFVGLQVIFILLDLVSMITLWYARRSKLFVPIWIPGRNSSKNWKQSVVEEEVHLDEFNEEAKELRNQHYKSLMWQFYITIGTTIVLTPLPFFIPYRIVLLPIFMVFSNLGLKYILSLNPSLRRIFLGELKQPLNKSRLISFHDNVFSILSTILVIEVVVPARPSGDFGSFFKDNFNLLVGFAVAFEMTTVVWAVHKDILNHIVALTSLWRQINQIVLATTCYIPAGALIAASAFADKIAPSEEPPTMNPNSTTISTTMQPTSSELLKGARAALRPTISLFSISFIVSTIYLLYWILLVTVKKGFLSKNPKLVAYRPIMLAKACALPICSIVGILLGTNGTISSGRRIFLLGIVFVIPLIWMLAKKVGRIFVVKSKLYDEEIVDPHHFHTSTLNEKLINNEHDDLEL
eukprot:m.89209 g.89209  ORF g.89209 m.89209 type:complete len:557 (+) comp12289_c1_seq1:50-1720(+)